MEPVQQVFHVRVSIITTNSVMHFVVKFHRKEEHLKRYVINLTLTNMKSLFDKDSRRAVKDLRN